MYFQAIAAKNQVLHQISGNLIDLQENLGIEKHKIEIEMTRQKKLIRNLRRKNGILSERIRQKDGTVDGLTREEKCSPQGNDKDDSGRESDSNELFETLSESGDEKQKHKSHLKGDNPPVNKTVVYEKNGRDSKEIVCYLTCYL